MGIFHNSRKPDRLFNDGQCVLWKQAQMNGSHGQPRMIVNLHLRQLQRVNPFLSNRNQQLKKRIQAMQQTFFIPSGDAGAPIRNAERIFIPFFQGNLRAYAQNGLEGIHFPAARKNGFA